MKSKKRSAQLRHPVFILGIVYAAIFVFIVVYVPTHQFSPENLTKIAIVSDGTGVEEVERPGYLRFGAWYHIYDIQGTQYSLYHPDYHENARFNESVSRGSTVCLWISPTDHYKNKLAYRTEVDGQVIHTLEHSIDQQHKQNAAAVCGAVLSFLFAAILIGATFFEEKIGVAICMVIIAPAVLVISLFDKIRECLRAKKR